MPNLLSAYALRSLNNEKAFAQSLTVPLLLWAAPASQPGTTEEPVFGTMAAGASHRPRKGEPVVFELRKDTTKPNPFAMGITVGRNENNDVVLDHPSISRFHAYFQQDPRTHQWKIVDAESKNGSWCGPLKLLPNQPQQLADDTLLRFGDLELRYYLPASFKNYLREQMSGESEGR